MNIICLFHPLLLFPKINNEMLKCVMFFRSLTLLEVTQLACSCRNYDGYLFWKQACGLDIVHESTESITCLK